MTIKEFRKKLYGIDDNTELVMELKEYIKGTEYLPIDLFLVGRIDDTGNVSYCGEGSLVVILGSV